MDTTTLKWRCSKSKFKQVMSAKMSFKENLGVLFNTTWELEVINFCEEGQSPEWTFYLSRNSSEKIIKVLIRFISNREVLLNRHFVFDSGVKVMHVFDINTKKLVDYDLNAFFMFANTPALSSKNEEYHILKLNNLSTSLQEMLEKELMTDVVLKCESVTLKAHKSILSSQSPVFEAMFSSPMLESGLDTVYIKDMAPNIMRAMITFMYSGQVKVSYNVIAYDLLYAAEKYQITALKEGCIEYFKSILSLKNAVKILEVSSLFDEQLKLHCLGYIKNELEELKSTKDWIDLKRKNPILALEVYSYNDND